MDALLRNYDFMKKLEDVSPAQALEYQSAKPFPHVIFDNFFPPEVVESVLEHFPKPGQVTWHEFDNNFEKKLAFRHAEATPTAVREFLYFLNSHPMLTFLEKLTSIPALIPDPAFHGGGLHQIVQGGKLKVHIDFNKLMPQNIDRRLNLILYLNKEWQEEFGGHFELWDHGNAQCVKKVLPIFNRCVVFSTSETSYHGHPNPLTCPDGWTRKSVAIYYYTNGRPDEEKAGEHTTLWLGGTNAIPLKSRVTQAIRYVTPPAIVDLYRGCKKLLTKEKLTK